MKRFLIASLSTLVLAAATPAYSGEMTAVNQNMTQNIVEIAPFNLVEHGYQGYFKEQGIPSGSAFIIAIKTGKISAEDLVKSGIARGRLTPETLNNSSYLHSVRTQLKNFTRTS
jgi:hypothetical protein